MLMVFKPLKREEMSCMLDKLMKEDWDNSKYCLRFDEKCFSLVNNADIGLQSLLFRLL